MQSSPAAAPRGRAAARWVPAVLVVYFLAIALWAGGLTVLGAVVAPIVFGTVPAPTSGDAMTLVFRRFDSVAITCAVLVLLAEACLAWRGGRVLKLDIARGAAATLAAALAIVQATILAPAIADLHRRGAIRGLDEAGLALERIHRQAETGAKAQLVLLLIVLVLLVVARVRSRPA